MFVVKDEFTGKYCRFGSYSAVHWVDVPYKATLYSRKRDADYQANNRWHSKMGLKVYEIEFSVVSEKEAK